jgi:hypothetical protein
MNKQIFFEDIRKMKNYDTKITEKKTEGLNPGSGGIYPM